MQMRINDKFLDMYELFKRHNYIYGGSSAGKTHALVQYCVLRMMAGEAVLVMKETKASIRTSIFNDFIQIINDSDLSEYFTILKSAPMSIKCNISNGGADFIGADKGPNANKGIKPSNGAGKFTILFADEADEIPKNAIIQTNLRIRGKSDFNVRSFYVFNPVSRNHWLFDDEIVPSGFDPYTDWQLETDDTLIVRCTYKDNQFLEEDEITYLEDLGKRSLYFKQVYLDAEPGVMGDRVIEEFEIINRDEVPPGLKALGGCDFGWNHPFGYVECRYDSVDRVVYIIDEVFGSHLSMDVVHHMMNKDIRITGDSEAPGDIAALKGFGCNIKGAKKPKGSRRAGITWLNLQHIKVVRSCKHTIESLSNYAWDTNRLSGDSTDIPHHDHSDLVDALRYCFEKYSLGKTQFKTGHSRNV